MQSTEKDLELSEKYNRPGSRYTSYPPVNHFREYGDSRQLRRSVELETAPLEP